MQEKLGLQESKNTFALYEQNALWEQPVAGSALIADILTRLEKSSPCKTEQTDTTRKSDTIKPNRQTRLTEKSGNSLSLVRGVRTESGVFIFSSPTPVLNVIRYP